MKVKDANITEILVEFMVYLVSTMEPRLGISFEKYQKGIIAIGYDFCKEHGLPSVRNEYLEDLEKRFKEVKNERIDN